MKNKTPKINIKVPTSFNEVDLFGFDSDKELNILKMKTVLEQKFGGFVVSCFYIEASKTQIVLYSGSWSAGVVIDSTSKFADALKSLENMVSLKI